MSVWLEVVRTYFFLWRCGPTRATASSFLKFLDHTWRTTIGRTSLDEWSTRRIDLYLATHNTEHRHPCPRRDSNPQSQQANGRDPRPRPRGHWDRHTKLVTDHKNLTLRFPTAKPLRRSQSYSWVTDNISISEQPFHSRPVPITPR